MSASRLYFDRALTFADLGTHDPSMAAAVERARIAAARDIEVLIIGNTGTGKNMLALAMHNESPRRNGPFVALNAAAIPETLVESELFGHEKGAFTGATEERHGAFEVAHGGTLFLDEIGNMTPDVQKKILTAVEHRRIKRVGGRLPTDVDFRLIAATNSDIRSALDHNHFRQDLYYRLARIVIALPPLAQRRADIIPFARRFLADANAKWGRAAEGFTSECEERLLAYDWPGNVRELHSRVSAAVAMSPRQILDSVDLFADVPLVPLSSANAAEPPNGDLSLVAAERRHIERILASCRWNVRRASELLKISRQGLYEKMRRYELAAPRLDGLTPEA